MTIPLLLALLGPGCSKEGPAPAGAPAPAAGVHAVNVTGGTSAWRAAGLPVEGPP